MRRFVTLAVLVFFAIPFGVSISGCSKNVAPTYCNGQTSGVQVGQLTTLDLEPRLTGISLNQGEIGRVNSPSGKDCRGNSANASNVTYASTNINIADIAPTTGALCGGSWNRNTGAGIADYTVCTPTALSGVAYVTTSSSGVVSNPIPIFIHPIVTSIVLGPASTNCTNDPASNCVDLTQPTGFDSGPVTGPAGYNGAACVSQGQTAQLVARSLGTIVPVFTITRYSIASNVASFQTATQTLAAGATVTLSGFPTSTFFNGTTVTVLSTGLSATTFQAIVPHTNVLSTTEAGTATGTAVPNSNISALVGPLTFSATTAAVVTIDANGLATAAAPGSSTITANISQASSTAGFFNTCPPASIVLSIPPSTTAPTSTISVNQNTAQPFTATVYDTNTSTSPLGNLITNITLEYISTTPTTIPTSGASTTPTYPGAGTIFAVCQPPSCNPSPFNEIGLLGNGLPVVSNPVQIASTGTNLSSVLYIASTNSQYILPIDFTVSTQPSPVRLPYAPNSMVISEDQSTIYMGTSFEIMQYSTATNALIKQDTSISGTVLAVSDDNTTIVVTDPVRQLVYLYLAAGGVSTEYGGTATSAQFSPDSQTVYITTADGRLLVHSNLSGWSSIPLTTPATDVAVTVPQAGVYLASNPVDVRTNCPATTINNPGQGFAQTTTNVFYPDQGPVAGANAIAVAATNDGKHIFGVSPATFTDIVTNQKSGPCPITFTSTPSKPLPLGALGAIATANTATGSYTPNLPTPYVLATSDSAFAFVSYQVAASQTTPAVVPQYNPATGALTNVTLSTANGTPTAPVAEVISADNNTLFVGTSGDNAVHLLTRGAAGFSDSTKPINPALPTINGTGTATPNLLVQHPRRSTS